MSRPPGGRAPVSRVQVSSLTLDAAVPGPDNPLPPVHTNAAPRVNVGDADQEMVTNMAYGHLPTVLPYLLQDGYGRDRRPTALRTAVVENDVLRAEFLLELGGRLWSLVHKPTGRELLYRNAVLQPGNLALRNAWFAGGVEWNIGARGHSPLTCEPLHAARVVRPDGTPVLRMYEYERMRRLVFQIDACLPQGSAALMVHIRILNPNDEEVPVYWWSNIAVPQADDVRVLAPADRAWYYAYDRTVRNVSVPVHRGADRSYATRAESAADYFYEIPEGERHWIAALDGSGRGLAQTSTGRLRGRKLFVWGTGPGSAHWQDWLSPAGGRYLEIQAGLARTQLEHLPMPAKASWSWVEAYGLLDAGPEAADVHGAHWARARAAAAAGLERTVSRAQLEAELAGAPAWADAEPVETLHRGSGWGALERRLRSARGDDSLVLPGLPFADDTVGPRETAWATLLDTGRMPDLDPAEPPLSYQVHPRWLDLLRTADDWLGLLHLGVALLHAGAPDEARAAWERSLACRPSAWALRNLAALDLDAGASDPAVGRYRDAVALAPRSLPLAVDAVRGTVRAGRPRAALDLVDTLPAGHRAAGRIRLAECEAALAVGELQRVGRLLDEGVVVPDLLEGETSLDTIWSAYHVARIAKEEGITEDDALRARVAREHPVPVAYDFRMNVR
ncbi:DUF5107 domain-containing protein [Streptomyces sp. NPDC091272]|uniref:DUF5107 domain-containing protein n=1 Tax=Streptomyces sp. NPDC091272 TaxID=3365981 RepID=UPI0038296466